MWSSILVHCLTIQRSWVQIHHLAAAFLWGIVLIGDLKFPIGVNGCVFLCLSPMTDWWPVQSVTCPSLYGGCATLNWITEEDGWIDWYDPWNFTQNVVFEKIFNHQKTDCSSGNLFLICLILYVFLLHKMRPILFKLKYFCRVPFDSLTFYHLHLCVVISKQVPYTTAKICIVSNHWSLTEEGSCKCNFTVANMRLFSPLVVIHHNFAMFWTCSTFGL